MKTKTVWLGGAKAAQYYSHTCRKVVIYAVSEMDILIKSADYERHRLMSVSRVGEGFKIVFRQDLRWTPAAETVMEDV